MDTGAVAIFQELLTTVEINQSVESSGAAFAN